MLQGDGLVARHGLKSLFKDYLSKIAKVQKKTGGNKKNGKNIKYFV